MSQTSHCCGCVRQPLIRFNAISCPPDMLHLKKGIITKLVSQLVEWALTQGAEDKLLDEMKFHKIPFV